MKKISIIKEIIKANRIFAIHDRSIEVIKEHHIKCNKSIIRDVEATFNTVYSASGWE